MASQNELENLLIKPFKNYWTEKNAFTNSFFKIKKQIENFFRKRKTNDHPVSFTNFLEEKMLMWAKNL